MAPAGAAPTSKNRASTDAGAKTRQPRSRHPRLAALFLVREFIVLSPKAKFAAGPAMLLVPAFARRARILEPRYRLLPGVAPLLLPLSWSSEFNS
jgi:hypothetical protein